MKLNREDKIVIIGSVIYFPILTILFIYFVNPFIFSLIDSVWINISINIVIYVGGYIAILSLIDYIMPQSQHFGNSGKIEE